MGYCQLPARRDHWKLLKYNSCLPSHWKHGKFGHNKFDYIQRNIHLGRPEDEETIDGEVSEVLDGGFVLEEEEEYQVETVPNNNDDWRGEGIDADDNSDSNTDM